MRSPSCPGPPTDAVFVVRIAGAGVAVPSTTVCEVADTAAPVGGRPDAVATSVIEPAFTSLWRTW